MAAFGLFRGKQLARSRRAAVTRHNVYLKLTPLAVGSEQTRRNRCRPTSGGGTRDDLSALRSGTLRASSFFVKLNSKRRLRHAYESTWGPLASRAGVGSAYVSRGLAVTDAATCLNKAGLPRRHRRAIASM